MSRTTGAASGTHILVVPYPAQGHLIPLLDLTHRLCVRGFAVTVVVTPKNLHLLNPLTSKNPSVQTLVLPFPSFPDIPPGVENVKDLPPGVPNLVVIGALRGLHDPLLDWFRSHPSPPKVILSDFFLGWTERLANRVGIPRLVFYSSGACLIVVTNWLWDHFRPADSDEVTISGAPGTPTFLYRQLPPLFRRYWENQSKMGFVKEDMKANNSSWGGVFNSFEALEGKYLKHLREDEEVCHSNIWAVGPLLPSEENTTTRGGTSAIPIDEVLKWLDDSPEEASVVYICFGSQASLKRRQCQELAAGIENSSVRFIWCLKEVDDAGEYGAIPHGFEKRTAGRGLVIRGWAPQVRILNHRAVAAFFTHCGWNSVLEGVTAGVRLLLWPMAGDQFVNARFLVQDLGVAVLVCEGPDTVPDSRTVARALYESVGGSSPEKTRAAELRRDAMDALDGGSSNRDLDHLVAELVCSCNLWLQHAVLNSTRPA